MFDASTRIQLDQAFKPRKRKPHTTIDQCQNNPWHTDPESPPGHETTSKKAAAAATAVSTNAGTTPAAIPTGRINAEETAGIIINRRN
jgi:hypothetical protein